MTHIHIDHFDDFLAIARRQTEPQQLLFVFTRRELPQGYTAEQEALFNQGIGGHLAPIVSVDKSPIGFNNFNALKAESHQSVQDWDVVFVAALPGNVGKAPDEKTVENALDTMIERIRSGRVASYLAFDNSGDPLQLTSAG